MPLSFRNLILLCLVAQASLQISHGQASPKPFTGKAYDPGTSELLYQERHEDVTRGGAPLSRTEYRSPAGGVIAERTLNFSRFPFKPDYKLLDFRDGYEESAEVLAKTVTDEGKEAAKVKLALREGRDDARKERVVIVPEPCVIDGGFNAFIKAHWEELAAGKRVAFNFVAPARRDWFAFEAVPVGYDGASTFEGWSEAKGNRTFVIRPSNRALRLLAPLIRVTYDAATRRVSEYRGISNVNNAKGKSFKVRIAYPDGGP